MGSVRNPERVLEGLELERQALAKLDAERGRCFVNLIEHIAAKLEFERKRGKDPQSTLEKYPRLPGINALH